MKHAQDEELRARLAEHQNRIRAAAERRIILATLRFDLGRLFGESDPVKRGKDLEGVLNRLFAAHGISVRDAFVLRVDGHGVVEQIDGVVELDGELYLVEVKWWQTPLGPGDVAQHLVRVFTRGHARGVFISASDYTTAAIASCKESLTRAVFVLCALEEFVLLLEQEADLRDFLKQKVVAAIADKNPYYRPLKRS
jgi:restriction system protein